MSTYNNILEAVGRTPLIRLNRVAQGISSTLYAKMAYAAAPDSPRATITGTMIVPPPMPKMPPSTPAAIPTRARMKISLMFFCVVLRFDFRRRGNGE